MPHSNAVAKRLIHSLNVDIVWTRDLKTLLVQTWLLEAIDIRFERYNRLMPHGPLDPALTRPGGTAKNMSRNSELAGQPNRMDSHHGQVH